MTDREEAKRLIEDYYQADDEIERLNDIIRLGSYDEDNPNEDAVETYINTLENEKNYLNSVYESDFSHFDWDELSEELFGRVVQ